MRGLFAAGIALLGFCAPSLAADVGIGEGAASYLDFSMDARALGMGQAQAASSRFDASALTANPANLTALSAHALTTTSGVLGADRSLNFAGYALPFDFKYRLLQKKQSRMPMAIAGGVTSLRVSEIEGRSEFGLQENSFQDTERAYHFSFAMEPVADLSMGFTGKLLSQQLHTDSASGDAYDIGVLYAWNSPVGRFHFAYVIKDFAGGLHWKVRDDTLKTDAVYSEPIATKNIVGVAYALNPRWNFALDLVKANGQNPRAHMGAEWESYPGFNVRGGINSYDPTLGLGYDWHRGRSLSASINYAFLYGLEGLSHTHWFGLSLKFLPVANRPQ